MISKSLLLLAFAALAYCQPRVLKCSSTWTGQSSDLPICTSWSAYPDMSKQCLQSEVLGYHQHYYTIDKDDKDVCLTVVIRATDSTGAKETYVYRGPMNVFQTASCEDYCNGVIESKKWFQEQLGTKLEALYVGCFDKNFPNNENLTSVVGADAGATSFVCSSSSNYAKDATEALPLSSSEPPVPPAINLNIEVKVEQDPDSPYKSIPGWYFIGLGVQLVTLVASLGVFIWTIMLYVGVKNSAEVTPNDFEMK